MQITRLNYEEYMLDYLEGNLSEEMYSAVATFLQQHPDLEAEMEGLQNVAFIPDEQIVYPHKTALKKKVKRKVVPLYWQFRRAIAVAAMLLMALMVWQVDVFEKDGEMNHEVVSTEAIKMPAPMVQNEKCLLENNLEKQSPEKVVILETGSPKAANDTQKEFENVSENTPDNDTEKGLKVADNQLRNDFDNDSYLKNKADKVGQNKFENRRGAKPTKYAVTTKDNTTIKNEQNSNAPKIAQTIAAKSTNLATNQTESKDTFLKKNPTQRTPNPADKQLVQNGEQQPTKRIFPSISSIECASIEVAQAQHPQIAAELLNPKNVAEQEWVMNDTTDEADGISPFKKAILPEIFTFNRREKQTSFSVEIPVKTPKKSFFRKLFNFKN